MPKRKRSSLKRQEPVQTQDAEALVTWPTHEQLMAWCPMCGMMSNADRFNGEPYPIKLRTKHFGGRLPGGKGAMFYTDDVDMSDEEEVLRGMLDSLNAVRREIMERLGDVE